MRLKEFATAGATSSGSIASLPNPHIANPDRNKKSYTGTPGKSGTKSPVHYKPKKQNFRVRSASDPYDFPFL